MAADGWVVEPGQEILVEERLAVAFCLEPADSPRAVPVGWRFGPGGELVDEKPVEQPAPEKPTVVMGAGAVREKATGGRGRKRATDPASG